ncbi:MAG: serine/threonine-protein kinase [Candidatus Hydrogenedentes bacterium]|nr:serine/threonine-protein kinase [Candidatus Hydrogenedentota bacterium]
MRNGGGALPARHILGNYELFEELGRGGMGIVYRALDLSLDRVVAVKILRDDLRSHPSIVTRFSREAQAAARLDHKNIVQIYSVGAVDRTPFIAMEYIDAMPLSAVMQREHRLDWTYALEIGKQIAAALACAHDCHVIHRDVKPPNILLDDRRHAYVTDFGIAKILTLDDNLTVDGTRLGTPHYMAPERCKNGDVTSSSDLYSLGVLMFQMLTGRLPYEASTPVEMIQRIISEPPARVRGFVPGVPEDVERLVAWLMEMNPKHRPANGHVVCEAIERVLTGKPLDASEARSTDTIEEFRRSLASSAQSKNPAHNKAATSAFSRRRITMAAGIFLSVGALAWFGISWLAGPATTLSVPQAGVSTWFAPARVAAFSSEGNNVHLAELQFPGYSVASITNAGADGAVAVVVQQEGAGGKHALCIVSPTYQDARLRLVSDGTQRMQLSAAVHGMQGSLFDGFALVHAGSESAFMSLRATHSNAPMTVLPESFEVADMHPSGSRWVAAIERNGAHLLAGYAWENGVVTETVLSPGGVRISRVQYSPDGDMIAFLREIGGGKFALRVIPATGVVEEPAPIAEGSIAIGNAAFNQDASAILVADDANGSLEAIATASGKTVAHIGAGLRGAWDITRNAIVFSAPDRDGAAQLWQVRADAPAKRTQLTFLDAGTAREVTITRDGDWAVTHAANTGRPSIVFARLTN